MIYEMRLTFGDSALSTGEVGVMAFCITAVNGVIGAYREDNIFAPHLQHRTLSQNPNFLPFMS